MKVIHTKPTELEKACDALAEYETIFGTNGNTENKKRDEEYASLKQKVKNLKS